jgi:probable HAF family extracellular repeat protein
MRNVRSLALIAMFASYTCDATGADAQTRYSLTVLDTGGSFAAPWAINNSGVVVGSVDGKAAFIGTDGYTFIDIPGVTESYARAVNDNGSVVVERTQNYNDYASYLVTTNRITQIVGPSGTNVSVYGLNNVDQVAGTTRIGSAQVAGFYGSLDSLHAAGNSLLAINDAGTAVGWASGGGAYSVGSQGETNLGTLGGNFAQAWDINQKGQIVGESYTDGYSGQRGFIFTNGVMTEISLPTWRDAIAYNINEVGLVIGDANTESSGRQAWLYDGTNISYLNDLVDDRNGFNMTYARGLNDAGQIVGFGHYSNFMGGSAYLLTPLNSVPEPATWAMMIGGMGLVGGAMRRRRISAKISFA